MFRTIQKKRTTKAGNQGGAISRKVRTFQEEDDDDVEDLEGNIALSSRRLHPSTKRKRPNTSRVRDSSLPLSVPDASLEPKMQKFKKGKTKGLGFGGPNVPTEKDSIDEEGASYYSKVVLSQLLQQQKESNVSHKPITSIFDDDEVETMDLPSLTPDTTLPSTFPAGEDFVHLDEVNDDSEILTGEEAMAFIEEPADDISNEGVEDRYNFTTDGREDQVDDRNWEAEVIRRAGIQKPSQSWQTADLHNDENRSGSGDMFILPTSNGSQVNAIQQLRSPICAAIKQIKEHQEDLQRRWDRQNGALPEHQDLGKQYESEMRNLGDAHDFYQLWRNEYILWMGALRELQSIVTMIQSSLHSLEHDKYSAQRLKEYDNDVVSILHENHVLEQVLGRQPTLSAFVPNATKEEAPLVDEFGRNVMSQASMQREKRRQRRRRVCEQRKHRFTVDLVGNDNIDTKSLSHLYLRGDESDGWNSDGEEESFRERHSALQNALSMAMNEIDEEYVTLYKLVDFFSKWYKAYPSDYKAACANQSFIDLAMVLIQAELCSLNDPWNESGGYNESKWIVAMHRAMDSGICDISSMERLFHQCIIPTLSDIWFNEGINLISSRQTRSICSFVSHLQKLLPASHAQWVGLGNLFTNHIVHALDEMAIPILKKDAKIDQASVSTQYKCEELDEAVFAATFGQLYRIKKVLTNVFLYWVPILPASKELRTLVLQFISNKLIVLLSSLFHLNRGDALAETPADTFRTIYQLLAPTGWLDDSSNMLVTATIRAAAIAYNIIQ